LLSAAVACTGEDEGDGGSEAFCEAYRRIGEADVDAEGFLDALRDAADLAPGDVRVVLDTTAALAERSAALGDGDDVTGDAESMELVARMQAEDFQAAGRRLGELVTEECGIDRTPGTFTPVTGLLVG
jgi:hypothetical protein